MKKYFFIIPIVCCSLVILSSLILTQINFPIKSTPDTVELTNNKGIANISSRESKKAHTDAGGIVLGKIAQDFSFTTIEGKNVQLSSLQGQPVIFSFALTTGCEPCIIEA